MLKGLSSELAKLIPVTTTTRVTRVLASKKCKRLLYVYVPINGDLGA